MIWAILVRPNLATISQASIASPKSPEALPITDRAFLDASHHSHHVSNALVLGVEYPISPFIDIAIPVVALLPPMAFPNGHGAQ